MVIDLSRVGPEVGTFHDAAETVLSYLRLCNVEPMDLASLAFDVEQLRQWIIAAAEYRQPAGTPERTLRELKGIAVRTAGPIGNTLYRKDPSHV